MGRFDDIAVKNKDMTNVQIAGRALEPDEARRVAGSGGGWP